MGDCSVASFACRLESGREGLEVLSNEGREVFNNRRYLLVNPHKQLLMRERVNNQKLTNYMGGGV